ncbi:4Fe-4S dicluster domain-containing protein [Cellulosilyticum sp. I15G10I2]|uniref:4Fe-4S dicluster domain-containing protein n=1 Tax=Cellulosilyticum sp. I15G10I2 TaxID=1892843 RepID=UPI00085C7EB7|nr:4Fe-4S dicluster domain-containing protein [Cellulosilyticum sp. I15G10I2]
MSHIVGKEVYKSLQQRLNKFPQGAPPSNTLYQILELLFTEEEAKMASKLPIRPFTLKKAAKTWNLSEYNTLKILEKLCAKGVLLDMNNHGKTTYFLPPPMVGFFEFSMMRMREDVNQKLLSELYHQYINVEEDFIKDLFFSTETKFGRTFIQEPVLSADNEIYILDFERASHVIQTASSIGISTCYCRHKMHHLDQACNAPLDICMTFGATASSLTKYGYARTVDVSEGLELLHIAYENNLVQCGENVREGVSFLCNCCGCCCEAMTTAKRFGMLNPIETTSFFPNINAHTCINCGKCERICPVACIEKTKDPTIQPTRREPHPDLCLGCGVCARNCPNGSITLLRRTKKILTPANTTHRTVLMAIEKGTLVDLICDNKAFMSHRAMAAVLSSILSLPPIKQMLASKQLKSIYLDRLLASKARSVN